MVESFSERLLTEDSDRLPAISGLAHQLSTSGNMGKYFAGMWEPALLSMLLWASNSDSDHPHRRPKRYSAPTWSWASIVGGVHWTYVNIADKDAQFLATILEITCVPSGIDRFGSVDSGAPAPIRTSNNHEHPPFGRRIRVLSLGFKAPSHLFRRGCGRERASVSGRPNC
jgi:hypothetical protein